jgi:hypothetical protein
MPPPDQLLGSRSTDSGRPDPGRPKSQDRLTSPPLADKKAGIPGRSAANVVAFFDPTEGHARTYAERYLSQVLGLSEGLARASVLPVSSTDQFLGALGKYSRIDRLVLMLHSAPGAILLGKRSVDLVELTRLMKPPLPQVGILDFESCNMGDRPDLLVGFASALSTTRAVAFNYFLSWELITIRVPKGSTESDVDKLITPYRKWLLPHSPSTKDLVHQPGTHQLIAEWFRNDYSHEKLPPQPKTGETDDRDLRFRPRSSAKQIEVGISGTTKIAVENQAPVVTFMQITIDLK